MSISRRALILTRAIVDGSGDEFVADDDVGGDFVDNTSFFWAFYRLFNGVLQLGALFAVWYLFNIYFNIFNKQVLQLYPFPLTVSTVQFGIGTLFIFLMWSMNLYKRPKISSLSQLLRIIPLAIGHTLGSIFTNVSLGMVAVSFTHTIKVMEPFFTVVLSSIFLGEFPTLGVLSSLLPVVGGVVLVPVVGGTDSYGVTTGFGATSHRRTKQVALYNMSSSGHFFPKAPTNFDCLDDD